MTINIISLAQECKKNPSLISLCKGHNQSLCKLALQQSGYTNELDKWHGRYCFVVKHLLKVINHSDKKLKLKNGKKILDIIKSEKLKIPQDIQRFIQKNIINQLGGGDDDIPNISKSEKIFNYRQLSQELGVLDQINELQHRIQQLENNLSDNQEVKLRQLKKLDEMRHEISQLSNTPFVPKSGLPKLYKDAIVEAQSYFDPEEPGEIFINKNDLIKIDNIYDGKAYGQVLYTNKRGFFPLTVLMN